MTSLEHDCLEIDAGFSTDYVECKLLPTCFSAIPAIVQYLIES